MKIKIKIKINRQQKLYVIPEACGYSCLGWKVCIDRINRLAKDLGEPATVKRAGSLHNYRELRRLENLARDRFAASGTRSKAELSPQLVGLEGRRVEAVTTSGDTKRFIVGRSTGWIPIHLEIARRNCNGGPPADLRYASVRVIS